MHGSKIKRSIQGETHEGCHPYKLSYVMTMKRISRHQEHFRIQHHLMAHKTDLVFRLEQACFHRTPRIQSLMGYHKLYKQDMRYRLPVVTRMMCRFCRLHSISVIAPQLQI